MSVRVARLAPVLSPACAHAKARGSAAPTVTIPAAPVAQVSVDPLCRLAHVEPSAA